MKLRRIGLIGACALCIALPAAAETDDWSRNQFRASITNDRRVTTTIDDDGLACDVGAAAIGLVPYAGGLLASRFSRGCEQQQRQPSQIITKHIYSKEVQRVLLAQTKDIQELRKELVDVKDKYEKTAAVTAYLEEQLAAVKAKQNLGTIGKPATLNLNTVPAPVPPVPQAVPTESGPQKTGGLSRSIVRVSMDDTPAPTQRMAGFLKSFAAMRPRTIVALQ